MKRLLNGSVMLLFLGAMVFASCQNETSEKKEKEPASPDVETTTQKRAARDEVNVRCMGNCDGTNKCGLEGVISSTTGGSYVRCKCSGCVMEITTIKGSKKVTTTKETKYKAFYVEFFQNYMKENYKGKEYLMIGYNLVTDGEKNVETYSFDLGDGKVGTIILVGSGNEKRMTNPEVKIVDCTGTCDCREVYNWDTGKVTCSCKECQMKTTIVKTKN